MNDIMNIRETLCRAQEEGISLSENKIEICRIGEQFRIEPIIIPENATNKKVTYLSFNEGIVSVDADGLATIVGEGSTVIQVETKDGGKRAYIFLNVKLEKLEQNSVMTMYYDETKKFVSDFIPPECNITFSNLNIYDILDETTVDEIVYISNDGFIKAKMPGSVRFIANANDATTTI